MQNKGKKMLLHCVPLKFLLFAFTKDESYAKFAWNWLLTEWRFGVLRHRIYQVLEEIYQVKLRGIYLVQI